MIHVTLHFSLFLWLRDPSGTLWSLCSGFQCWTHLFVKACICEMMVVMTSSHKNVSFYLIK